MKMWQGMGDAIGTLFGGAGSLLMLCLGLPTLFCLAVIGWLEWARMHAPYQPPDAVSAATSPATAVTRAGSGPMVAPFGARGIAGPPVVRLPGWGTPPPALPPTQAPDATPNAPAHPPVNPALAAAFSAFAGPGAEPLEPLTPAPGRRSLRRLGDFERAGDAIAFMPLAQDPTQEETQVAAQGIARRLVQCRQLALVSRRSRARLGLEPASSGAESALSRLELARAVVRPRVVPAVLDILTAARVPHSEPGAETLRFAAAHDIPVIVAVYP